MRWPRRAPMSEPTKNIRIRLAFAGPEWQGEMALELPAGSSIEDAIRASGIGARIDANAVATAACGIWGRQKPRDHVLREGDRVEIYRPLQADPKDARRAKAAHGKARQRQK